MTIIVAPRAGSALSSAQSPRIKRKPPPAIDTDKRYPSPDPNDPFAPLWVLRNRSSNVSLIAAPGTPVCASFEHHRSANRTRSVDLSHLRVPSPDMLVSDNGVLMSLDVTTTIQQSHYRRRSQSTPPIQVPQFTSPGPSPLAFPTLQSHVASSSTDLDHLETPPVPSLLTDTRTNSDSSSTDAEHVPSVAELSFNSREPLHRPTTALPDRLPKFTLLSKRKARSDLGGLHDAHTLSATPNNRIPSGGAAHRHIADKALISSPLTAGGSAWRRHHPCHSVDEGLDRQPEMRHFFKFRRPVSSDAPIPLEKLTALSQEQEADAALERPPVSAVSASNRTNSDSSSSFVHVANPFINISEKNSNNNGAMDGRRKRHKVSPSAFSFLSNNRLHAPKGPRSLNGHSHPLMQRHERQSQSGHPLHIVQAEWAKPTREQLAHAALLPVIAESGVRMTFGSLFASQRTVIIFIRHFWCSFCQDYMSSLVQLAQPESMYVHDEADASRRAAVDELEEESGQDDMSRKRGRQHVQLVVIGNGSHTLITKYRQMFDFPFNMYTDPSLAVYTALGMGKDGAADVEHAAQCASFSSLAHNSSCDTGKADVRPEGEGRATEGESYVRHGLLSGIAMVVVRALKMGMPVWEKGGDIAQLGGEFVLGPGLICTYAHRMQNPKGHAPVRHVLHAAGVKPPPLPLFKSPILSSSRQDKQTSSVLRSQTELKRLPRALSPLPSSTLAFPRRKNSQSTPASTPAPAPATLPAKIKSAQALQRSPSAAGARVPVVTVTATEPDHDDHERAKRRNSLTEFGMASLWATHRRRPFVSVMSRGSYKPEPSGMSSIDAGDRDQLAKQVHRQSSSSFGFMSSEDEAEWMAERTKSLERLREKKMLRRGGSTPRLAEPADASSHLADGTPDRSTSTPDSRHSHDDNDDGSSASTSLASGADERESDRVDETDSERGIRFRAPSLEEFGPKPMALAIGDGSDVLVIGFNRKAAFDERDEEGPGDEDEKVEPDGDAQASKEPRAEDVRPAPTKKKGYSVKFAVDERD